MAIKSEPPARSTGGLYPDDGSPDLVTSYRHSPYISPDTDPRISSERRRFFSAGFNSNERLASFLEAHGQEALAAQVRECHREAFFVNGKYGRKLHFNSSCRNRLCWFYKGTTSGRLRRRYRERIAKLETPYYITLTYPNVQHLAHGRIQEIRQDISRLRRRTKFNDACRGGIYRIDAPHTASKGFNPHVDLITDLHDAFSHSWLSKTWRSMGGGYIVKIEPIGKTAHDLRKVFQYITKPQPKYLPETKEAAWEYINATHKQQMFRAFGSCWGTRATPSGESPGPTESFDRERSEHAERPYRSAETTRGRVRERGRRDRATGCKPWR